MNDTWPAPFDYAKSSGCIEIRLRLDFLATRLGANLAGIASPRVIEIGIGTGDCTTLLAARFAELTALDIDAQVCQRVAERLRAAGLPMPKMICAAVETHRFEGRFHAIVLQNILEHLDDPVTMLQSLRQILEPSGRLYINVPLAHSLHRLMGVELGMIDRADALAESDIRYGHRRVYTPDLMLEHIEGAKLRAAYQMPYYLKPFSTAMLEGLSEAQHIALFDLGRKIPELASYFYVEAALP